MKINSQIVSSALLAVLLPFIIGVACIMAVMIGEYRGNIVSVMELSASTISSRLASFFEEGRSAALVASGMSSA